MDKKSSAPMIIGIGVIVAILLVLVLCHKKNEYRVYFKNLTDGAQVESPFKVEMAAENLVVEPAANGVADGHGHFHIIIDSPLAVVGEPVPMDSAHLHFGKGQTEAMLNLSEGDHTLILQFADGSHYPYDPQVSQTVRIHVTRQNLPPMDSTSTSNRAASEMDTVPPPPPPINPGMGGTMNGVSPGVSGFGHP